MDEMLWEPSPERVGRARATAFRAWVRRAHGVEAEDLRGLHAWSVERPDELWPAVWRFAGVLGEPGARAVEGYERMPGARWFPEARFSFAENLLRRRGGETAVVFRDEAGARAEWAGAELAGAAAAFAALLREEGVGPGDAVAGLLPNVPEAVAAMLGASMAGAVWSSCSPDFGAAAVLDRFGEVRPKVLVGAAGHRYGGRVHDGRAKLAEVLRGLPSVRRAVVVGYPAPLERAPAEELGDARSVAWDAALERLRGEEPAFERRGFDHPLYVLFSSGTTGRPKCIVHSAGGALLQHVKEHQVHCDVRPGDRVLYYTTLGWMMWNWLVSALASEAAVVLYEGSPSWPHPARLLEVAGETGASFLGTSARYLGALRQAGAEPRALGLEAVRTIASTGSPLAPETFDWVYASVKEDVHLASISGGTDIVSCFVLGDPTAPVHRGEIQCAGLGMAVDVFDASGRPVRGEPGELVCTRPFPSMPLGFLGDPGGERYRAAYFERFPGVWHHGDLAEITPRGGFAIHGRSDATLNPGGVRIGTAEIYRVVESVPGVADCVAIGHARGGDERIVLFVVPAEGTAVDDALRERIRRALRERASPRHVPALVLEVPAVPRTRSGKKSEYAAREAAHGREVANHAALANPDCLAAYRDRL